MTVEQWLQYAQLYGVPLVILVALGIFLNKMVDRCWPYIDGIMRKALKLDPLKDTKKKYEKGMRDATLLDAVLFKLLNELDADRAAIFQFHNGGKSVTGIDFIKMSMTHEVTGKARPIIRSWQNLPIGVFAKWNIMIMDHQMIKLPDVQELEKKQTSLWGIMADHNIKSVYALGLYDLNDFPIGMLIINFTQYPTDLTQDQIARIIQVSGQISGILQKA